MLALFIGVRRTGSLLPDEIRFSCLQVAVRLYTFWLCHDTQDGPKRRDDLSTATTTTPAMGSSCAMQDSNAPALRHASMYTANARPIEWK